jgi:transcriptional activator SPT8
MMNIHFQQADIFTASSASNDILRIYDVAQSDSARHRTVPFTIVPGHRGGVISSIYIDPTCRFMLSSAGNRGWEGGGTEVLLGYEIGVQDENGIWHK